MEKHTGSAYPSAAINGILLTLAVFALHAPKNLSKRSVFDAGNFLLIKVGITTH